MFQVPFQNSRYTRLLFVKVGCIITIVMSAGMADVKNAWELLLDNKPHEASGEFKLPYSKNHAGFDYSLVFSVTDTTLTCNRIYTSNFTPVLSPETCKMELVVLKGINRADDVKLIFTRK